MSQAEVVVSVDAGMGRIHLNRPRAINALSAWMLASIARALAEFAADPSVTRVELTGEGFDVAR